MTPEAPENMTMAPGVRCIDIRVPHLGSLSARVVTEHHVIADFPPGGPMNGGYMGSAVGNWLALPSDFEEPPKPWPECVRMTHRTVWARTRAADDAGAERDDDDPGAVLGRYHAADAFLNWCRRTLVPIDPILFGRALVRAEAAYLDAQREWHAINAQISVPPRIVAADMPLPIWAECEPWCGDRP